MSDALLALRRELAQINDLSVAARVLEWDQLVMMPRGGAATRGDHLATISRLAHELFVRDEIGELLGVHGVVCTHLEHDGAGRLTGRLRGANCRGPEKARRVEEWLRQAGFTGAELWCYGDSASDDEFLAAADHPVRVDGVRIGLEPG